MPALAASTSSAPSVGSPSTVHARALVLGRQQFGVVAQRRGLQQRGQRRLAGVDGLPGFGELALWRVADAR